MLVEIEGHTVPHFKAPVYAKMELWGPECGGTFSIQTSLLNISHLLHKMRFVWFVLSTTILLFIMNFRKKVEEPNDRHELCEFQTQKMKMGTAIL